MRRFERLMWIAAGLVLLAGAPLLVIEDRPTAVRFAGLTTLFLGAFGVLMALDGLDSGTLRLQNSVIRRTNRPRLFLALVAGIGACGLGVIILGAWAFWVKG